MRQARLAAKLQDHSIRRAQERSMRTSNSMSMVPVKRLTVSLPSSFQCFRRVKDTSTSSHARRAAAKETTAVSAACDRPLEPCSIQP
eukprot:6175826-Pleurochrysis_carterae.AAC.2